MMKKILFVMTTLSSGGITSSLLNLLEELKTDPELNIDVMLFNRQAGRVSDIPEQVNLLSEAPVLHCLSDAQKQVQAENRWFAFLRFVLYGYTKLFGHGLPYRIFLSMVKKPEAEYDYAFSCTQSAPVHKMYGGCNEFVLQRVKAKKKIAFIHCDYVTYGLHDSYNRKIYERFDRIAFVSESCRGLFAEKLPQLAHKTHVVTNCFQREKIRQLAEEDPVMTSAEGLQMVTVARLGDEKGHFRIIKALSALAEAGYHFHWHVVGGGNSDIEQSLRKQITVYKLEKCITLYGDQSNPYRIMKNCDALLLASYHEAAPMVFEEAVVLGLPILTTATLSAEELVGAPGIGLVCENTDEGIHQGIKTLLEQPELLQQYRSVMAQRPASNEKSINEFYQLMS